MAELIYGVDPEAEVIPENVRDAIVDCFYEAHCADTALGQGEEVTKPYCREIVRKAFADAGGDFEAPDKAGIEGAMIKLADFSKSFRDPSIIDRHMKQVGVLVRKLH